MLEMYIPDHVVLTWWKYNKFHYRILLKCPMCKAHGGNQIEPKNNREMFCDLHGTPRDYVHCQLCGHKWNHGFDYKPCEFKHCTRCPELSFEELAKLHKANPISRYASKLLIEGKDTKVEPFCGNCGSGFVSTSGNWKESITGEKQMSTVVSSANRLLKVLRSQLADIDPCDPLYDTLVRQIAKMEKII